MTKDKNVMDLSAEDSSTQDQTISASDPDGSTGEGQVTNVSAPAPAPVQIPQNPYWPPAPWHQWGQYPYGTNSTGQSGQSNAGHRPEFIPGQGMEPYPVSHGPPYLFPFNGGRPELGDPLYTSPADGPELRLITQSLTGTANYHSWARDFRRALVTKSKEEFIEGKIPYPMEERLQRHWRRCNQLVRTWIGNCLAPDVAAGLPPTEDPKQYWDNLQEMYGKSDRARLFSLTQALTELK